MIRKLRFRLVFVSMLSLIVVLAVIMGGLNVLNYRRIVNDADGVLALLRDNGGSFPKIDEDFNWPAPGPRYRSPELPFEMRFFSVLLDGSGAVMETDTERIAAVDADEAQRYAREIWTSGKDSGFRGIYRYARYAVEGGETRIIFLDCGRSLAQFRNVLRRSALISAIGLTAVFLLIVLLSGRIVRPISRSYEKQKRFISDAGHEIRTPITIIDADAEILEMDYGENEWLTDIRQQAARMADLTNDLIFLSRMEEQEKVMMIDFPLSDVVSETAVSFQALAMTQEKRFEMDVEPMLSMNGNEKQIRQLVSILLDNAIKYSDNHGQIRLSLQKRNRVIYLVVENTADSISKELIDNMFERFYRGDPSHNSATKGYGIGLSIAKAVVDAHKGRISAEGVDERTMKITAAFPTGQAERRISIYSFS